MRRLLALVCFATGLHGMELDAPVDAYWHLRGIPPTEFGHRDLTIHLLGSFAESGQAISLFYYRFAIPGDDGGLVRERELLLVVQAGRLHGWYQITGTSQPFALASVIGKEVIMPDGSRQGFSPLPSSLSDTITVEGKPHVHRSLFHPATAP